MRDEKYNFCNKIVIPDTRPLPDCLWLAASPASARLEQTCCVLLSASATIRNQHAKVTGGDRRCFPSLSEAASAAQTPSISIFIHSRPVATALGRRVDACCILMGRPVCSIVGWIFRRRR